MENLPQHLQKYIVEQNYAKYTPIDHAVWRYVLRQLRSFLKVHAHESYLDGLEKTGIEIEKIPSIASISEKLQKFGWRALPVSGFIPPAAFMELQSLNVLPIASDMRSIDHLLYTPAPDIVHEAAGHAPILVHPEYAEYLRQYAQVAKKAILSKEDLDQYEAIRTLSDLKENPNSTAEEIADAEENLSYVSSKMTSISEAAELSRMNWWTAEYGLIGDVNNYKIYGAGLLSSKGESKLCISDKVKKIPMSIKCVQQGYDITEPQPQLFVTKDFKTLVDVLKQMSEGMAYRQGGTKGLDKAIKARSLNTVQLDTNIQISGQLEKYVLDSSGHVSYLKFSGPTQLSFKDIQIPGHGKDYHKDGYSTPLGDLIGQDFKDLKVGKNYFLKYTSGVQVDGTLEKITKLDKTSILLTFSKATSILKGEILFKPDWGNYDIVVGKKIISVFGGPADRVAYGETVDFIAAKVVAPVYTDAQKKLFKIYQDVRDYRGSKRPSQIGFDNLIKKVISEAADQWLLFVELFELATAHNFSESSKDLITQHLETLRLRDQKTNDLIQDGINLSHETN
ncbi:MAG: aromatic amino acid hydroxylase [Bdellovibrio sp.]|nr:aromatic amino acid hydroxylase [Bdellovibrio sp.]